MSQVQQTIQETIGRAKRAIEARDFESALATLQTLDVGTLDPMVAVRVLMQTVRCLTVLGRTDECIAQHRIALAHLHASGVLAPESMTGEFLRTALMLAVGAHDAVAVKKYLRMSFGELSPAAQNFKVSPVVALPAWCQDRGIPVELLDSPQQINIGDDAGTGKAFSYESPATWHATIPNAEIISGWDFPIAPTGEVLNGANYLPIDITFPFMPHAYSPSMKSVAHVWSAQSTCVDADAVFLSTPEHHHFGHWVMDFLTRLRVWDKAEHPRRKIVISSQLPAKHRDMMACFGVTQDDLMECDLGHRYKFRSLRVVQIGSASWPNPQNVKFLYEGFRPPARSTGRGRGFFLVRDAGTRMPANQDELDRVLEEFGVTKVNPAKLTYAEQKSLFADAAFIISVFGTEVFCLYNMPVGSAVVELIWDANDALVCGALCAFLGMKHHLIVCESAANTVKARRKVDRDLIIDCAELRRRLAQITASA